MRKNLKLNILSLLFLTVTLSFSFAHAVNFYPVSEGIYRGPRPKLEDLKDLKYSGVKTIINIDDDMKSIAWERKVAEKMGFKFISVPMSGFRTPKDKDVNRILNMLVDKSLYPLFLHCKHGQDRTGLLIGLFRVFHEAVNPEDAYDEMLQMGFHPSLFLLKQYYEKMTGLED